MKISPFTAHIIFPNENLQRISLMPLKFIPLMSPSKKNPELRSTGDAPVHLSRFVCDDGALRTTRIKLIIT